MAADRVRLRPFVAAHAGVCIITGKPYPAGVEIRRHGDGYARYLAPAPPGWTYTDERVLVRIEKPAPAQGIAP